VLLKGMISYFLFFPPPLASPAGKCPKPKGEVEPHIVLLKGMSMKQKLFKFRNSWGKTWGRNGCFYVRGGKGGEGGALFRALFASGPL